MPVGFVPCSCTRPVGKQQSQSSHYHSDPGFAPQWLLCERSTWQRSATSFFPQRCICERLLQWTLSSEVGTTLQTRQWQMTALAPQPWECLQEKLALCLPAALCLRVTLTQQVYGCVWLREPRLMLMKKNVAIRTNVWTQVKLLEHCSLSHLNNSPLCKYETFLKIWSGFIPSLTLFNVAYMHREKI